MKINTAIALGITLAIGTVFLFGGVVEEESENQVVVIPIREIHEEVIQKFVRAMGFGYSRMITVGATKEHQLTHFVRGDESYKVNLIGLVKNPRGSVYESAHDRKNEALQTDKGIDLRGLRLRPKTVLPTTLDKRAIALFNESPSASPQLLKKNGKWIGHGPIRATEARCIKCHEVKKDTLLGVFRYEFIDKKL